MIGVPAAYHSRLLDQLFPGSILYSSALRREMFIPYCGLRYASAFNSEAFFPANTHYHQ